MIQYKCGCVNEVHGPSGVLHSVRKCDRHRAMQRDPATLDERYYEELGIIKDGKLPPTRHVEELTEALGEFPRRGPDEDPRAVELGCGVSPYARAMRDAGWCYTGVDTSEWTCDWMRRYYDGTCVHSDATAFLRLNRWMKLGLVLAAHVLEHLEHAPAAIAACADILHPGGELWIVVPDDSDPVNPDHLWYWQPNTLQSCVEKTGLVVQKMAVRQHVPHEKFIYLRAQKPKA